MSAFGSSTRDVAEDPHFVRIAAVLTGLGALGVIATSACYAIAGPQAALPGGAVAVETARAASMQAAGWMRAASLFGMPSDVLFTVGGLMLAATRRGAGAGVAIAGWLALAIAGVLFTIVDSMVGFVLLPMAALVNGEAAYVGVRALFDVLFAIGAWTVGAGALAIAWSAHWPEYRSRTALWLVRASGVIGVVANSAYLLGLPGARLIGPGVALGAVALLTLAIAVFRSSRGVAPSGARQAAA